MLLLVSCLVALFFGLGAWLLLRRNLVEVIFGLLLLSHGANLALLIAGGWQAAARAPVLRKSAEGTFIYADPLPQALILTAMVIGFGLLAFLAVLVARAARETGSVEAGELPDEEEVLR